MFSARFLMPMGEVIMSSDNKKAIEEMLERVSASIVPESERPQGPALSIQEFHPGTNPG